MPRLARLAVRAVPLFAPLLALLGATFVACSGDDPPANTPDTGLLSDSGSADAQTDGGTDAAADSGTPEAFVTCPLPFSTKLSEMSLYSDMKARTIGAANVEFKPAYELWTDGAGKRRWIAIPAGQKIDTSDMDQWEFPVCTRLWKEFSRDGKIVETRLWQRTSKDEYLFGTYIWNEAQTEATWSVDGADNVLGTAHDVPNLAKCLRCHEGVKGRGLGFGAVQLAKGPMLDLAAIAAKGWLTNPPVAGKDYGVPGNATEAAALGWLNANCGHCHNSNSLTTFTQTDMVLRLYPLEGAAADTKLYKSTIGVPNASYKPSAGPFVRIDPGSPATSTLYVRDATRDGASVQMPPIGTEIVHPAGLAAVKAWIESLPKSKPDAGADAPGD